jgi:hypothetical protein
MLFELLFVSSVSLIGEALAQEIQTVVKLLAKSQNSKVESGLNRTMAKIGKMLPRNGGNSLEIEGPAYANPGGQSKEFKGTLHWSDLTRTTRLNAVQPAPVVRH